MSKHNKEQNAAAKEQIEALKNEKKKAQEELDELRGRTTGGKIICVLVLLGILALLCVGFIGMVKLNVGGFASDILAPAIDDVPVIRSILPAEYQKKTAKEILAEQQAATEAAKLESESAVSEAAASEAAARQQAESQAAAASESESIAASEAAASEAAASETAASEQKASEEAALEDYVKTYSEMKPKSAAQVLDNMMPDQSDLVVKILSNMAADQRAAIISNMSVANASQVTILMEK